mmetsp:Transcript_72459/g.169730  ORF Transcript_72459/g.169730 Transcript_72459/m.169730 type:complete len:455 (+) Transcript_72459:99-1463(+)
MAVSCDSAGNFTDAALWLSDDADAGLGLLSLRVARAAGKMASARKDVDDSVSNCDSAFILGVMVFVLCFTGAHRCLQPFFQDTHKSDSKPRMAVLDNAKFCMLTLVIFNHTPGTPLYKFVEFHTRLLALISGWVTRNRKPDTAGFRSLGTQALGLFLYVAILGPFARSLRGKNAFGPARFPSSAAEYMSLIVGDFLVPLEPNSGTHIWYMEALIFWQVSGFLLFPFGPAISLLIALGGFVVAWRVPPIPFAVSDSLTFLPFFFLGRLLPVEKCLQTLPQLSYRCLGAGLVMMTGVFYLQQTPFLRRWMDITSLGPEAEDSILLRPNTVGTWMDLGKSTMFGCIQLVSSLVFLICCCPRSVSWYTDLGKHSLYTYQLHQMVINVGGPEMNSSPNTSVQLLLQTILFLVWASLLNAVLASTHRFPPLRWILEPNWIHSVMGNWREHQTHQKTEGQA